MKKLSLLFIAFFGAFVAHNLYAQVTSTGRNNNDVRYVDGIAFAKSGAGINAAINSFGSDPACGTIVLPYGIINIEVTVGGANTVDRSGCVLKGQGAAAFDTPFGADGTILLWTGAANGTVVDLHSCWNCYVEHLHVNGNTTAGIGVDISASMADGISVNNSVKDVNFTDITGTPGIGARIGSSNDWEVEAATLDTIYFINTKKAMHVEGVNTFGTNLLNISVSTYSEACFDGVSGQAVLFNIVCGFPTAGATAVYRIRNTFRALNGISLVAENSGTTVPCLKMDDGSASTFGPSVSIDGGACASQSGSNMLNYTQNGMLTLKNMELGQGNTITINPAGPAASGYIGSVRLENNRLSSTTVTATGDNYSVYSDNQTTGPAQYTGLSSQNPSAYSVLDKKTQAFLGGSQSCFMNANVTYCWVQSGFNLRLMQDANILMQTGAETTAPLSGGYPLAVQDLFSNSYHFGAATTAYPGLFRSGTTAQVRLGDNSGDAPLTASNLIYNTAQYTGEFIVPIGYKSGPGLNTTTDDEDDVFINRTGATITITEIFCRSNDGTPTVNLLRNDGSAANIFTSDMTCDQTPTGTNGTDGILTSFVSGENVIADGQAVNLNVTAASTAERATMVVKYTKVIQ